ncbi:hypothetical protein B5F86_14280 [Lachnoclostridium sp. An298]|nr:hypothetical protein B5F86_14280 [Lachnoclostridium sp. An298]
MKCKVCGQELKNGAKFCVKCGTKVEIEEQNASFRKDDEQRCSVCGKSLKPGAKFCSKCGSRVILSDLSSEESIPEEENHGQSDRKKTSDISIKMSNVENDIVNPFLLNGKNPCESILHPKLNPLQKKRKSISREVDYKELEIAKKREEEAARRREEEERRRQEEEEAARREEEERRRQEEEEAARRREEEERRRQEEEEAARRREEEERRHQEEDRVYREEIDKKLAQMESIHEEIIPDEQSIIQNVEDNLIEVSETGQTYVPKEDHIVPQQFTRGFRTERVEKLARAKPSKLRK